MAAILDSVRPGDVISSDLINRIIALVNAHDAALSAGGSGSTTGVMISDLVPPPPLTVGQEVRINGANFRFLSGSTVLTFDGVQVNAFKLGSSDTALIVNVPLLSGLGAGRDVVLSVSNSTTTATRIVRVLPLQQPQQGNVDVGPDAAVAPNPNPNPVLSGQPATFAYFVRSRAILQGTFAIAVRCSDAAMQAAAQILDSALAPLPSGQIDLAPGQQKGFLIRIPSVTLANGASFTLTVSASTPGVAGSDTRSYTVNSPVVAPDPNVGLAFNAFTAVDAVSGNPDSSASYSAGDNTLRIKSSSIGRVNLFATFTQAGTYDVTVQTLPPTVNWVAVRAATPAQYVIAAGDIAAGGGSAMRNPAIGIQANAGASATGQARLRLQRQGSTQFREITFNLALLP
jgi:hypothetical protein